MSSNGSNDHLAVPVEQLRWRCDPDSLGFETTEEIPEQPGIIGQDRAVEALRLGITMRNKGYNVFVSGASGTGRTSTVKHVLESTETDRGAPPDILYVNNFRDSDRPLPIVLPNGQGRSFCNEMRDFVVQLRRTLTGAYQSDEYKSRNKAVVSEFQEREKEIIRSLETSVKERNFALIQIQMGSYAKPEIAPLIAGEPVQMERLESLVNQEKFSQDELTKLRETYEELRTQLESSFTKARQIRKELKNALAKLENEFGEPIVSEAIEEIKGSVSHPRIAEHLGAVRDRVLENVRDFLDLDADESEGASSIEEDERFRPYLVNLVVDNTGVDRPPVVVETSPNYRNLFGTIERVVDRTGHWRSDFLHIKGGSVLRASGGFLVIQLSDALAESGVWQALKRTLKNRKIDIQSFDPFFLLSTSALKPEPIEVDVRVIVVGNAYAYHMLLGYDPDFHKIFKVKAEFDSVMTRDADSAHRYASFIRNVVVSEGHRHLDKTGVAAIVEEGARVASHGGKVSTLFGDIADLVREANYWAGQSGEERITRKTVQTAIENRERRVGLTEEKIQELITDGSIIIESSGRRVGQINGLSVYDMGDHRFGKPSRITAQTAIGQGGIVSIEREAELSGRSFNKAMLILDGFFRARFGQDHPLSVNASIAFEQSYGEVDGDSASVAEVCALLSSLSDVPLRQDIALTGSCDQNGTMQPIGGVNEKIEGFFAVCESRGLNGSQGVLIPTRNVRDLMLRHDVVAAVQEGQFHIFAAETVDQAVELMTGMPAGERDESGDYPEESIYGKAEAKLRDFAEKMKEFSKPETESDDEAEEGREERPQDPKPGPDLPGPRPGDPNDSTGPQEADGTSSSASSQGRGCRLTEC